MESLRNKQSRLASVVTHVRPTRSRRSGKPVENREEFSSCAMNAGDPMGSKGRVR
jgi:hypothetical protein